MRSIVDLRNTIERRIIAATGCHASVGSAGLCVYHINKGCTGDDCLHLAVSRDFSVEGETSAEGFAKLEQRAIAAVRALGWCK